MWLLLETSVNVSSNRSKNRLLSIHLGSCLHSLTAPYFDNRFDLRDIDPDFELLRQTRHQSIALR